MKTISLYIVFVALFVHISISFSQWRFSVIAGISKATADQYGGFQSTKSLVMQQFQSINTKFNQPRVFNGTFEFAIDSIYQFDSNTIDEIFVTHPKYNYRVVYDAFPTQGGGWYGPPYNAIHHSWSWDFFDGTFGQYATDGITHEFGHARGALDLYAMQVSSLKNQVNGQSYSESISIMNYPYGVNTWDIHSIKMINRNAGAVYTNVDYVTSAFPSSIGIQVFNTTGQPIPNAEIKVYPVIWYTDSVATTPLYTATTNAQGEYVFSDNPFSPLSSGYPWDIRYPNFIVAIKCYEITTYNFMSLTTVQNSYFANLQAPYRLIFGTPATSLSAATVNQPSGFILFPNYPNPFNPTTNISFSFPSSSFVSLMIFDALGREVSTLMSEELSPGTYSRQWNATGLSSGVYFYRLQARKTSGEQEGSFTETKKLILQK